MHLNISQLKQVVAAVTALVLKTDEMRSTAEIVDLCEGVMAFIQVQIGQDRTLFLPFGDVN